MQHRAGSGGGDTILVVIRLCLGLVVTEPGATFKHNELRIAGGDGEIERAWPYFRAIGEVKPVAKALENIAPDDANDGVLQIAYFDRVAPRKGFELILEKHGICRAITCFHQYPQPEGREESAGLLVRRLCSDLAASIKRTIEQNEPGAPDTGDIAQLIEGRDWLFEGSAYYIDTSHVASVVQLSPNLEDPETLRLVLGLTEYGRRLPPMRANPVHHTPHQSPGAGCATARRSSNPNPHPRKALPLA